MINLIGVDKIWTLSLRIVTGILNGSTASPLFNWDIRLCKSSLLVDLSWNEFKTFKTFLNGLLESGMVFDKFGSMSIQKIVESISNLRRIHDIFAFYFENVWMNFVLGF